MMTATAEVDRLPAVDHFIGGRASLEEFADPESPEAISYRESFAHFNHLLGPLQRYVADPAMTNIEVNEDGTVWVELQGRSKFMLPDRMSAGRREALIGNLANRAEARGIGRLRSRLPCDLPYYDCRVQAFAPPVSFWSLVIRGFLAEPPTLDDYQAKLIMTPRQREFFRECIRAPRATRPNIVVAGGMDAGKTTLVSGLATEIAIEAPGDRIVILQDRREIKSPSRNKLFLFFDVDQEDHSPTGGTRRYTYDAVAVLKDYLRTNGVRVIFGELRDPLAALALTLAMNTGSNGLVTTLHANSGLDSLYRIEDLLRTGGHIVIRRMIARFVNVVAHIEKDDATGQRRLTDVLRVTGVDKNDDYTVERIA